MTPMQTVPGHARDMQGYVRSIAFTGHGRTFAMPSSRGGTGQFYSTSTAQIISHRTISDVCGIAAMNDGVMITSGAGDLMALKGDGASSSAVADLRWDNPLISMSL